MENLPHRYQVKSEGLMEGNLTCSAEDLPVIFVAPPQQFDGPGDQWSPEDLLMASVANCLILSFRAIAKASKLEWVSIECETLGTLDKVERKLQFTDILSRVRLLVATAEIKEKAEKTLVKAEAACIVSNSLACESRLEYEVIVSGD